MKIVSSFSLRMKFALLFTLFTGAVSIFIYSYFPNKLQEQAMAAINRKTKLMTTVVAMELRSGVLFNDRLAVREDVKELGHLPELVYVVVQAKDGTVLAAFDEQSARKMTYDHVTNNAVSYDGSVYQTMAKIIHDKEEIGRLYLGMSLNSLQQEVAAARVTVAWVSLGIFVVGTVLVLLISTIVTTSLSRLGATFGKIAAGDLSERADVVSRDEIGQLAASFNTMVGKVEQALQKERELHTLKSRFISTVSHEFRTPLTSLGLTADLLLNYHDRMSREEQIDLIRKMKKRIGELSNLISEFLLQSAATSMNDVFSPENLDIVALADDVISVISMIAASRDIQIEMRHESDFPHVYGDRRLLQHILRNLLSNAVKYSPEHSTVHCALSCQTENILIRITDHGIGIPSEDVDNLFAPFFRASNSGGTQGTGLGLSIVKECVEIHGGTITVESTLGAGTTFTVFLPVNGQ